MQWRPLTTAHYAPNPASPPHRSTALFRVFPMSQLQQRLPIVSDTGEYPAIARVSGLRCRDPWQGPDTLAY